MSMADSPTIKVITPATSNDLLTLDELKTFLKIPLTDTSEDAYLAMQIAIQSEICAEKANRGAESPYRTFGQQQVIEIWRGINSGGRLWLTHYPIDKVEDITSISAGDTVIDPADYEIDLQSGKLSILTSNGLVGTWSEPITIAYTGGYLLPDEAPYSLKAACALSVRDEKTRNQQAATAGVRRIQHRDASIQYFDPNSLAIAQSKGAGSSPSAKQIDDLLMNFTRVSC
jgi:hypothetical protein